ncbi:uncharacterized protein LOC143306594 [Osmia lignaria lignaria]|uniref:uncharacterized protein LOC143306594 n=1 Tax=Osmia lignaria lignaria TaxID=1437193 RepID=UPI00402BD871
MVSAAELRADLVVVSEPYTIPDNWFGDTTGRAAIFITSAGLAKCKKTSIIGSGNGYVGISYNGVGIVSVYISPNASHGEVESQFAALDYFVKELSRSHSRILVMGDFNAKSPLWGTSSWCRRGRELFQLGTGLGLRPIIAEGGVTCERGRGSMIDILLGSDMALKAHKSSVVREEFSASDHKYILHSFSVGVDTGTEIQDPFNLKGKIDEEQVLVALLKKYGDENFPKLAKTRTSWEVDRFIEDVGIIINRHTVYRRPFQGNHKPAYWWTEATAEKRREVNRMRRKYT